ncbi:hypothetical protein B0H11DRAFT_1914590 [Mycena galericulata]|nr:hypothetical protein B0H11DRAFT_1914590 [Mycena galericulata]
MWREIDASHPFLIEIAWTNHRKLFVSRPPHPARFPCPLLPTPVGPPLLERVLLHSMLCACYTTKLESHPASHLPGASCRVGPSGADLAHSLRRVPRFFLLSSLGHARHTTASHCSDEARLGCIEIPLGRMASPNRRRATGGLGGAAISEAATEKNWALRLPGLIRRLPVPKVNQHIQLAGHESYHGSLLVPESVTPESVTRGGGRGKIPNHRISNLSWATSLTRTKATMSLWRSRRRRKRVELNGDGLEETSDHQGRIRDKGTHSTGSADVQKSIIISGRREDRRKVYLIHRIDNLRTVLRASGALDEDASWWATLRDVRAALRAGVEEGEISPGSQPIAAHTKRVDITREILKRKIYVGLIQGDIQQGNHSYTFNRLCIAFKIGPTHSRISRSSVIKVVGCARVRGSRKNANGDVPESPSPEFEIGQSPKFPVKQIVKNEGWIGELERHESWMRDFRPDLELKTQPEIQVVVETVRLRKAADGFRVRHYLYLQSVSDLKYPVGQWFRMPSEYGRIGVLLSACWLPTHPGEQQRRRFPSSATVASVSVFYDPYAVQLTRIPPVFHFFPLCDDDTNSLATSTREITLRMEAVSDLAGLLAQPDRRARGQAGAGRRGLCHAWSACARGCVRGARWGNHEAAGNGFELIGLLATFGPPRSDIASPPFPRQRPGTSPRLSIYGTRKCSRSRVQALRCRWCRAGVATRDRCVPHEPGRLHPQRLQLDLFTRPRPNAEHTYTPTRSERLLTHAAPLPPPRPAKQTSDTPPPAPRMGAVAHSASFSAPAQRLTRVYAASVGVPRADVQLRAGARLLDRHQCPAVRPPEIAIDLEHNSYRSYSGIVCLMQISTRTQDWIVNTLALRAELATGALVFTDPAVVKMPSGAGVSDRIKIA